MVFHNKKAERNFHIIKTFEAGIVLTGNEIKSIRNSKVNFIDSYAIIKNGEVWLKNLHISPYERGFYQEYNPTRDRKLLLNKNEIRRLEKKFHEKGFTLVPISLYLNEKGLAKIELALAKGKRKFEKRKKISEKDAKKELKRMGL